MDVDLPGDTINVDLIPPPIVDLGPDRWLCDTVDTLDPGIAGGSFLWSTFESSPTIIVTTSGTYSLEYSDPAGACNIFDTVEVNFLELPYPDLGNDTLVCSGDTLTLYPGPAITYFWNTGSIDSSIQIFGSGTYSVDVVSEDFCPGSDQIVVTIGNPPTAPFGQDTASCDEPLLLDAANTGMTYEWSTGGTTQFETIDTSGIVSVTVTDLSGCQGVISINVAIVESPVVNLGNDRNICPGSTECISAGSDPLATYLWSTGQTTASVCLNTAGEVWAVCTDIYGCQGADTVEFSNSALPVADFSIETDQCPSIFFTDESQGFPTSWIWDFGDGATSLLQDPIHTYTSGGSFDITLSVAHNCGTHVIEETIEVPCLNSITEEDLGYLRVYPNPNNGVFVIELDGIPSGPVAFEMLDLHGKTVFSRSLQPSSNFVRSEIDAQHLAKAIYLLKINVADKSFYRKVMLE